MTIIHSLLLWLTVFSFIRHDFHTSLAQVNYNPSAKTFEVSLRVFTDDLEAALSKEINRKVVIDASTNVDAAIEQYATKHFALIDQSNQKATATLVGKEIEVDVTWIYLEFTAGSSAKGLRVQNSILMDLFDDQVNIVNLSYLDTKRTLLFKQNQKIQPTGF